MYPALPLHRLAIFLPLMLWLPVQAAEWTAAPKIALTTGYDDNVRLTTNKHDSVWQTNLDSSVRFGVAGKRQGIFGDAGFSLQRFTGGSGRESSSELDRENYHLNTNAYHNTLLDTFRVNLNISQRSILDSELDETGNVNSSRDTRQLISVTPSWGRTINEKTRLDLSALYSEVTFPDGSSNVNQVESDSYALVSNLSYQFTPLVSGNLSATASSFRPETGFNSDSINLQAGISRIFSDTLSTTWLVGQRETKSDSLFATGSCLGADPGATFPTCAGGIPIPTGTDTRETTNTGLVYTARIEKQLETGKLSIAISRSANPISTGELLDSTRLDISGIHRLSRKLTASLNISYTDNETIVNRIGRDFGTRNRKFLRITPVLKWRWNRDLSLDFIYSYARSDTGGSNNVADRNKVSVKLSYNFPKLSVSR